MTVRACLATLIFIMAAPAALSQPGAELPCAGGTDKACLSRTLENHPVRRRAAWKDALARPLDQRVVVAPAALVEYLLLDNVLNGYPERPRASDLDPAFLADVTAAIAGLPPSVWRLFEQRLVGVYFVDGLGGTGYTEAVADERDRPVGGFIVLDASVLRRLTANQWATWKENTPFKVQAGHQLTARIERDGQDNHANAIRYILLHELGHVLSIGGDIHPPWGEEPRGVRWWSGYPFFDLSWKLDRRNNRYASLFDTDFAQRKDLSYYFGARLAAADMQPTYASLMKTNFPTLYAATRPGDDFAEAFANYVHVVMQQRPWEIAISRDGAVVQTFKACWEEPRCAAKRKLLERILEGPP